MAIYLDNSATTRVSEKALEAMVEIMRESYGNASSVHGMGIAARGEIEKARGMVGKCLGMDPARLVFTSGATEANNAAILHYALEGERMGRRHIVVSAIEHPSVLECCRRLEKERGFFLSVVYPDRNGVVDVGSVAREILGDTCMVCLMAVNNETGMIQPFRDVARICEGKGIPYHCDATQAVGHISLGDELKEASIALSAHKFHGPKGVGCLMLPTRLTRYHALLVGGAQENNRRAGTENVAGIVGMAVALSEAHDDYRIRILRGQMLAGLENKVGGVLLNGAIDGSVPHILNVSLTGVKGDGLVSMLSHLYGVYCSTGSACCSGSTMPSGVLRAMGMSDGRALSAVRISLSRYTTEWEIDRAIDAFADCVKVIRDAM